MTRWHFRYWGIWHIWLHSTPSDGLKQPEVWVKTSYCIIQKFFNTLRTICYYQYIVSSRSYFIPSNNPYKIYQTFSFLSQGAEALLECGADPLNVGKIGQSPLQVAHSSNAKDVAKVLQVSNDHFVQIQIYWNKANICGSNCTFSTGLGKRAKGSWNCQNCGRRSRIQGLTHLFDYATRQNTGITYLQRSRF